jgi:hypothetical protein
VTPACGSQGEEEGGAPQADEPCYAVLKVKRGRYLNGKNSNAVTNNPADSQSTSLVIIIELPLHCKLSPHCPFMKT